MEVKNIEAQCHSQVFTLPIPHQKERRIPKCKLRTHRKYIVYIKLPAQAPNMSDYNECDFRENVKGEEDEGF